MKYTKNEYKRKIKMLNKVELQKEYGDLHKQLYKASLIMQRMSNPYHKGELPVKLIKWKLKQVTALAS